MQFGQHLQNMRIHKGISRMQLCTTHICHCCEILDGDKAERAPHNCEDWWHDDYSDQIQRHQDRMTNTDDNNMPGNMSVDWCIRLLIRIMMIVMTDQVRLWTRQHSDVTDSWTLAVSSDHPGSAHIWLWPGAGDHHAPHRKVRINPGLTGCQSVVIKLPLHPMSIIQIQFYNLICPFHWYKKPKKFRVGRGRDPVDGSHYWKSRHNYGGSRDIVTTSPHDNHVNTTLLAPVRGQYTITGGTNE